MHIYSAADPEFAAYGRTVEGPEVDELLKVLDAAAELPEEGTKYVAEDAALMALEAEADFRERIFGGMPTVMCTSLAPDWFATIRICSIVTVDAALCNSILFL